MKYNFFSIFSNEFKRALTNSKKKKKKKNSCYEPLKKKLQLEKKFCHLYMKNKFFSIFSNEFHDFKRALANFFPSKKKKKKIFIYNF